MRLPLVLLCWLLAPAAQAQIPDPSIVQIPDLATASNAKAENEGWKYFFFHKDGISFRQAYSDLADCYRFLGGTGKGGPFPLPDTAAWSTVPKSEPATTQPGRYGIVGDAIGAFVQGPIQRRILQSRLRRCMEPRGYVRFPIDEEDWKVVTDGYSEKSIAIQAKLASGPRPPAKEVSR